MKSPTFNRFGVATRLCSAAMCGVGWAVLCLALASPVHAAFAVDGNLGDWGIAINSADKSNNYNYNYGNAGEPSLPGTTPGTANYQVIGTPATGGPGSPMYWNYAPSGPDVFNGWKGFYNTPSGARVDFQLEDTADGRNNYWVGPVWGGQNYDAEFLGVAKQENSLFVAISGGQRSDNGDLLFAPGDLRIKTRDSSGNYHYYGMEVGGGSAVIGPSTEDQSWVNGSQGATFDLNVSGYTMFRNSLDKQKK